MELMTVGGGCFWCVEAIFNEIEGVEKVISGYTGGTAPGKPTYREVCSGLTGHAEVVQVTFDSQKISFEELLVIFMASHDPTSLNRQGGDMGTQYRSAIFYHNTDQKHIAEAILKEMTPYYENPLVTEINTLTTFYEAEPYHQNYYANNPTTGYCSAVITPKLVKLRQKFATKLKTGTSL